VPIATKERYTGEGEGMVKRKSKSITYLFFYQKKIGEKNDVLELLFKEKGC